MLQLLSMMAQSSEFGQMAIREEELPELDALARDACHFDIKGGPENKHGKVNILLQVSAASPLYICCMCDYQSDVFACCWAGIAPAKRWRALLLFALPQLMSLAASSFWVSKVQQRRLSTQRCKQQAVALVSSGHKQLQHPHLCFHSIVVPVASLAML